MGFEGLMLNEHHSTPFCMQGVTNTQNVRYRLKVHVEEMEAKAAEVGRKYLTGVRNPEIARNRGEQFVQPWLQSPPELSSREAVKRRLQILGTAAASGSCSRAATIYALWPEMEQPHNLVQDVLDFFA
jgi:hypothetical protein